MLNEQETKVTRFDENGKIIDLAGEGIYGVRCKVCMKLVENWGENSELCTAHKDFK